MEMANSDLKLRSFNDHNILDTSYSNFRNEDFILKLNTMQMLKFFKDEVSIKYIGKGYNSIDYAVRIYIRNFRVFKRISRLIS